MGRRCQYGVQNGQYRPNWYHFPLQNIQKSVIYANYLGQIQVLEETAMEIEKLGYECVPRGVRAVKGVGNVPTYFVKMDENFNLVRVHQKEVVPQ